MQTVTTQLNELTLRDDEILVVRSLNPDLSRTAEPVEEMYTALEQLLNGKRLPMLWDPRAIRSIRPDGWVAIIDRLDQFFSAMAIVIDDQTAELFGGYPGSWNSLLMPVRQFENETDALAWLQHFGE